MPNSVQCVLFMFLNKLYKHIYAFLYRKHLGEYLENCWSLLLGGKIGCLGKKCTFYYISFELLEFFFLPYLKIYLYLRGPVCTYSRAFTLVRVTYQISENL